MLLDTPTLYYRAYFALPESIAAPDGRPVNAVRGTLDFISHLVTHYRPDHLIACFDAAWRPAFRVELLPSYKTHRVAEEAPAGSDGTAVEEVPDTLTPQVDMLLEMLAAFGIADGWAEGFEADDAIAAYAAQHRAAHGGDGGSAPVDVVTGDRDMFQLVDDASGVRVFNIARGVAKLEIMDDAALDAKYGVTGSQYADFATLRGDASDGLPGVAGIGEKTAATLLAEYGSLTQLRAAAEDATSPLKPAVRKKLDAAHDYLAVAPDVVRVRAEAPTSPVDPALPTAPKHPDTLQKLTEQYGLAGPVKRLTKALAAG
ncbi:5'-3' exonuclease [Actinospica durhamensis]|uniref:5'-3' exonuclease n=2 Tax=Actinospica durhamensis TaxID=1508375 RepID=A0A941ING8_9ACTN|nr:5'-3' exonuclease [Actinospica durhamensis]